ncbi:Atrophin-1 multi-domain protein [Massilia aurea]|uniref:Atrophin-1 multi-domain protein n=1 Tax=Massilia aurea TaxID=373040 RepID=UPI0034637EC9
MTPASSTLTLRILLALVSTGLAAVGICADRPAKPSQTAAAGTNTVGHFLRPYAASSLWNARPVKPVFGTFEVPKSSYFPTVASGGYSTGVFLAAATDPPVTVIGSRSTDTKTVGVADPDNGASRLITIPRWPAGVLPAVGTDGHADIIDPITKTIHSFWYLRNVDGQWKAAMYSWSKLNGTGWGDPAHHYQGARAVGVPPTAGLIRKHEIRDGQAIYPHALAMSLTFNALANGKSSPAYVFPATAADNDASANTGAIPQGALMMLPPDFDGSAIVNPDLKKIVETLKVYGAYVVDRNTGTPFVIYVENDAGFKLMPKGWDNTIAGQLDQIRAGLRQVVSAQDWIGADGKSVSASVKAQKKGNILSMRGPWQRQSGTASANYDQATQSLVFDAATTKSVQINDANTGLTRVNWAVPAPGTDMTFTVAATGGATLRVHVLSNKRLVQESKDLADGQSLRFSWPADARLTLVATSGTGGPSSVKAHLAPSP